MKSHTKIFLLTTLSKRQLQCKSFIPDYQQNKLINISIKINKKVVKINI